MLFLKGTDETMEKILELIAKQMINVEKNLDIWGIDGKENTPKPGKQPFKKFNVYNIRGVTHILDACIGRVNIYLPPVFYQIRPPMYLIEVLNSFICKIEIESNNILKRAGVPLSNLVPCSLLTTQYTQVYVEKKFAKQSNTVYLKNQTKSIDDVVKRFMHNENSYVTNQISQGLCLFGWHIRFLGLEPNDTPIMIPEFGQVNNSKLSCSYLYMALSSIIWDGHNIYNVSNGHKQADYPSLEQYTFAPRVSTQTITCTNQKGLNDEIFKYNMNLMMQQSARKRAELESILKISDSNLYYEIPSLEVSLASLNIKRVVIKRKWYDQIRPFDYKKQETDEANCESTGKPVYPNDICFITRVPLYGRAIVVEFDNSPDWADAPATPATPVTPATPATPATPDTPATPATPATPKFHILIHPELIGGVNAIKKFLPTIPPSKMRVFSIAYPVPAIKYISKIPGDKGNIMRAIETYGIAYKDGDYYVCDPTSKKLYLGINSQSLSDIDAYRFNMSSAIHIFPLEYRP